MGRFQSRLDVAGEELLEFKAGLSSARSDFAKERVGYFESGAHGSILAQKRVGLKLECPWAMKGDGKDASARTPGMAPRNGRWSSVVHLFVSPEQQRVNRIQPRVFAGFQICRKGDCGLRGDCQGMKRVVRTKGKGISSTHPARIDQALLRGGRLWDLGRLIADLSELGVSGRALSLTLSEGNQRPTPEIL